MDLQEATLVSLSKLPSIVVITDSDPNVARLSVPEAYGRSQLTIQEDDQGDDGHHEGYRGNKMAEAPEKRNICQAPKDS